MLRTEASDLFGPPAGKLPAYAQAADRIRRAIQLGQFEQGERLPTEADLALQLGFSRVTVREAIRHLEGEGLLDIRRGARGGLFVRPNEETEDRQLAELRARWKEIDDLFDFRLGVECAAARLAANRRTADHLARMAAALDAFRSGDKSASFRRADSAFHLAFADAADNAYLRQAIEEARIGMFLPFDVLAVAPTSWSRQPVQHQAIFDAIEAGDPARAEDAMRRHLDASRRHMRALIWGEEDPPR
jgi:GntR family transcriptional regulator, transcriptional repressor for pyruvate dehydrogenase complex